MTSEQHNRYVAYSFFAFAGFQGFWLLVMMLWFFMFLSFGPGSGDPEFPPVMMGFMLVFMSLFFILFTVPALVAGWAMLKQKPWARIAGIVGAVFCAMSAPVGTAACIYSLWFWTSDRWKEVYQQGIADQSSTRGLAGGEQFEPADQFSTAKDWMKEPPDWR
jgi:hypothetical protein